MRDYHFKRCLEKKSLIKFNIDKNLIKKEIAAAESDLKDSEDVLNIGKYKLATITAYYSMSHAARPYFIQKGLTLFKRIPREESFLPAYSHKEPFC